MPRSTRCEWHGERNAASLTLDGKLYPMAHAASDAAGTLCSLPHLTDLDAHPRTARR